MFKEKKLIYRFNLEAPDGVQSTVDQPDLSMVAKAADFPNPTEKLGFKGQKEALKLIKAHQGKEVVMNVEKYKITDYKELALALVKALDGALVMDHLLPHLDLSGRLQFIDAMIQKGEGDLLAEHFEDLKIDSPEFRQTIALKIAASNEGAAVGKYLPAFHLDNHDEIALTLIETGKGYAVARYINHFKGNHYQMALSLIAHDPNDKKGHQSELKRHLSEFNVTPEQKQEVQNKIGA